jgi:hypothetical protein
VRRRVSITHFFREICIWKIIVSLQEPEAQARIKNAFNDFKPLNILTWIVSGTELIWGKGIERYRALSIIGLIS